jgi:hypothetical protein
MRRDSLQSALTGYRNRIAQVRTSPGEGGTNLYPGFWLKAARLLNTFADGYRPADDTENVMTCGTPTPQPVIRQVPRE